MATSCTSVLTFSSRPSSLKLRYSLLFIMAICTVQMKAQGVITPSVARPIRDPFDFKVNPRSLKTIEFEAGKTASFSEVDNRVIDSLFLLDKNYDFEFRLWSRYSSMNFNNVFILRLSNNTWTARYFDLNECYGDPKKFKERTVDQSKVHQLWSMLVRNKVLTLPDMKELQSQMVNYEIDTTALLIQGRGTQVMDGVLYSFELLTPAKKRYYSYANPSIYMKLYSSIAALAYAQLNVLVIQKFLGKTASR